jgi:hypothetical protein
MTDRERRFPHRASRGAGVQFYRTLWKPDLIEGQDWP